MGKKRLTSAESLSPTDLTSIGGYVSTLNDMIVRFCALEQNLTLICCMDMVSPYPRGPFRLSVPSRGNDVLSVTPTGKLFYDCPDQGHDDWWLLMAPNTGFYSDGFYLVSQRYGLAINYRPERGEELSASPVTITSEHTIWNLTPESEIYTFDNDGERRYLWSVLDSIYVTPDEHLAERWTAVPMDGYLSTPPPKNTKNAEFSPLIILITLFALVLLYSLWCSK